MDAEPLPRIDCDPARMAAIIEAASLRSGTEDAHDVMFSRVYPDRLESPASSPEATQASFCTGRASQFDSVELFVEPPVEVLFDIDAALETLAWFQDASPTLTLTFEGDPAGRVTTRLVHEAPDARVTLPAETDWTHHDLSLSLSERFAAGQFLDATGEPVPTTASLDTDLLERLVRGSDLTGEDTHTLRIDEDSVGIEGGSPDGISMAASVPADVSGPPVT